MFKEIKQKLKVDEYVFEIEGRDIYNTHVIYTISEANTKTSLSIELNGEDKDGNNAWISFDLCFDINYLNTLSKIPTDITNFLRSSESFIKKPNKEDSEYLDFNIPQNKEEDIYKNLSSLWVSKIDNNNYIFKLSVPKLLFTYFTLNL